MYDIIIIGGGTAGLTAGIYGARAGKKVIILEGNVCGGQIIYAKEVENYPGIKNISGYDFANNLYNQNISFGVEIKYEKVLELKEDKTVVTSSNIYKGKSIIIATGATRRSLSTLNIEGEKDLNGHGISYCATCDGNFFKGKEVAVVGGGNTALDEAIYLSDICSRVYLIHRRNEFRGDKLIAERVTKKENIQIILNTNVIKLYGSDKLESIDIKNNVTNEVNNIKISGLFVAIGTEANNQIFDQIIELDKNGYIVAGEDCKTNIPGVFAAGDCRTKFLRQLTTASADGSVAAINALNYIRENSK